MLENQIHLYAVDTGNFYSNREERLHRLNHKLRSERKNLQEKIKLFENELKIYDGFTKNEHEYLKLIKAGEYDKIIKLLNISDTAIFLELCDKYCYIFKLIELKNTKIVNSKNKLLKLLSNKVKVNKQSNGKHHIRELRENSVSQKNIISIFDSSLTRTIGCEIDNFTDNLVIIQIYYFDILNDLMNFGFIYNGEKYRYYTSSAGQIRTKKTVFIKESIWNKYQKTIMCGLSIDEINSKGGCNPNKFLAYTALSNSATDLWKEFDIDKSIVIDDFETQVFGTFDYIDEKDYSIMRKSDYISITHTDGAGMILPNAFDKKQKNMMVRLPWIKGLLGVFSYDKFIKQYNGKSVIKDIYGVEHDIIKEDIQVIFTKSQFKMAKFYSNWDEYKNYYKQYNCTAGCTNIEEDRIRNATINYQMLQSLTDITDDEINDIIKPSINRLLDLCSSVENVKKILGATPYNLYKTPFQKAITLYPELLNDIWIKAKLRDIKDSLVKEYKAGKLSVLGKYTFILPDFFAACEYWFMDNKNPEGLLNNGEVFCALFRKSEKLDCLRSPHLFCEHAIRTNTAYIQNEKTVKIQEWFTTNALYTSCKDLISKILQFDVDGDTSLVVADKTIIKVVERNIEKYNVVPLYYDMKKAQPAILNNHSIYEGLIKAFTGGNIGIYSNNISKIWNSEVFISGTDEQQKHAIDCIKRLCCQNNFVIDYAKTLYKPEFPKKINQEITKFTKNKLPHFFKYAKDKTDAQIEGLNDSFINKLEGLIPNPRISCKYINGNGAVQKLGKPDYKLLMTNPDIEIKIVTTKSGRLIDGTHPVVLKYIELAQKYGIQMSNANLEHINRMVLYKSELRQQLAYNNIIKAVKQELSRLGYVEVEIVDILVKYLYSIKNSKSKELFWTCYGDYLLKNLKKNCKPKSKDAQCCECGRWFEIKTKDNQTTMCSDCYTEYRKQRKLETQRMRRAKMKSVQQ